MSGLQAFLREMEMQYVIKIELFEGLDAVPFTVVMWDCIIHSVPQIIYSQLVHPSGEDNPGSGTGCCPLWGKLNWSGRNRGPKGKRKSIVSVQARSKDDLVNVTRRELWMDPIKARVDPEKNDKQLVQYW